MKKFTVFQDKVEQERKKNGHGITEMILQNQLGRCKKTALKEKIEELEVKSFKPRVKHPNVDHLDEN